MSCCDCSTRIVNTAPPAPPANTIYSADDVLAGNRTVDAGSNNLSFTNLADLIFSGLSDQEIQWDDTAASTSIYRFEQRQDSPRLPFGAVDAATTIRASALTSIRGDRFGGVYTGFKDGAFLPESGLFNYRASQWKHYFRATSDTTSMWAEVFGGGTVRTYLLLQGDRVRLRTGTAGGLLPQSEGVQNQSLTKLDNGATGHAVWRYQLADQSYQGFINSAVSLVQSPTPAAAFLFGTLIDPNADPTYTWLTIGGGGNLFTFNQGRKYLINYKMTFEVSGGGAPAGTNRVEVGIYDNALGTVISGGLAVASIEPGNRVAEVTGSLIVNVAVGFAIQIRGVQTTGADTIDTIPNACELSIIRLG